MSLLRDGRNRYMESDKGSRKLIPAAKARVNRVNRRADAVMLNVVRGVPDEVLDAGVESRVLGRARVRWVKTPDVSLGEVLAERERSDLHQ